MRHLFDSFLPRKDNIQHGNFYSSRPPFTFISSEVSGLCPDQAFCSTAALMAVLQNISCPVDGAGYHACSFHRPGCRGGTPARRFVERPSPMAVQQNISCPAFAFAVRASMARTGQHTGHHAGSLCQMLKNRAVNAVMRGFSHAASVRHFVKTSK